MYAYETGNFFEKHVYFEKFFNKYVLPSKEQHYLYINSLLCGNLCVLRQENFWFCSEPGMDSFFQIFKRREGLLQTWVPNQCKIRYSQLELGLMSSPSEEEILHYNGTTSY